jgi:hypothetical protein
MMSKKLPPHIQSLTERIEQAREDSHRYKKSYESAERKWLDLYKERERLCSHKYADGTSAWSHNYAYSDCKICGYGDL